VKRTVILTQKYQAEAIRQLANEYNLIIVEDSGKSLAAVLRENPGAEALISFLSDKIDREIIDLGSNLKIIANYAVGYNNIDVEYAASKGIPVSNTPDVLTGATADMAMALILAVARRIVEGDELVRQGKFNGWGANLLLGKELDGCMLGIAGMGRIGTAAALRARGFGMTVAYYDNTRKPGLEKNEGFKYMTLDQLLRQADIISVHLPSTPDTHHLFNREKFALMKPDAIFVNTARGDLVNEADLVEALENRRLFGAGLDVYEFEPAVTERLKQLKNVVLAPHTGSATYKTRLAMAQMTIDNVRQVFAGQPPQNLVNKGP
jgi:glyoxylate reductase